MYRRFIFAFALMFAIASAATAQQVFTSGLLGPSKVIFTPRGNLLVAESGNGPNSGRISVVDRITGQARPIVSGLPSAIDTEKEPSGPSGLVLRGNTLYVSIGGGDQTLAGPAPGSETPNPAPSSPLLSSILALDLGAPIDEITGGLTMTPATQSTLAGGVPATLGNGTNSVTFRLVFNQPNYRSEPRPDFAQNVRGSDPWGLALIGNGLYVSDAGWNEIDRIDLGSGSASTVTTFPPVKNPTPVGPPVVDAVPDSIRADGNRLIVTLLTGFPFAHGVSSVVSVDPYSGAVTPLVTGLTTALDAVPLRSGSTTRYVIAEISTDLLTGAPGTILLAGSDGSPSTITPSIAFPTSIAVDPRTGEIFATQIFPGTLAKIDAHASLPAATPSSIIPVVASLSGAYGSQFGTSLQLTNREPFPVSGVLTIRTATRTANEPYQLGAFQTIDYPALMSAAGLEGAGSVDINAASGPAPVATARIFDRVRGTGAIIPQISPDSALFAGEQGLLAAAADPASSRTNLGIRALDGGATVTFTLYRNGTAIGTVTRAYAPNELLQQRFADLFGTAPAANDTVVVSVESGAAIAYVAVVDNTTGDTSFRAATPSV